jgi:hypothetical protein
MPYPSNENQTPAETKEVVSHLPEGQKLNGSAASAELLVCVFPRFN